MTGWRFGGWPPPPPAENTPALMQANPRTFSPLHAPAPVTLIAGATGVLPGPALGFIRIFETVHAFATTASEVGVVLQPSGLQLLRTTAVSATASTTFFISPVAIGFGETIEITNTDATDALTYWYSYYDIPDTDITLVRATFSDTLTPIIPAAPAGSYRRFLTTFFVSGTIMSFRPLCYLYNDDTVAIVTRTFLGAAQIAKGGSVAALAQTQPSLALDCAVTTQAYGIATTVAVTTRPVVCVAAYQTFAGTPGAP